MRFLYEQFTRYRDDGMAAFHRNDAGTARYNLLRAAECLLRLAHYSTGGMREARVKSANKLMALASSIDTSQAKREDAPLECASEIGRAHV